MRLVNLVSAFGLASLAAAHRSPMHVGKPHDWVHQRRNEAGRAMHFEPEEPISAWPKRSIKQPVKHHIRAGATILPQNKNTTKFAVDGTAIPDVDFDIGESYAGLLPISKSKAETRELFFWFFPSKNPDATDEIVIWLNGGPGCSSLEGLLQENGPFIWQYGTYKPVKNPWTWVQLSNILWVEQPVGTGFSQGKPSATNEDEVAEQFLGFFKNFVDTFGLYNKKIYITGESYAGYYVPYIASHMLDKKNTKYFNNKGIMIYDPSTSYDLVQTDLVAVPFADRNTNLMPFNASFSKAIHAADEKCGFAAYREKYVTYPPKGKLPTPHKPSTGCDVFNDVFNAALDINPCFDIYQAATTCPVLWDVLGFPGSFFYRPQGAPKNYFNRKTVQRAINAPIQPWGECQGGVLTTDTSKPSGLSVLPGVIERTNNVIISHGAIDMVLILEGTLVMIQNMTWHGKQGFQTKPASPFYVPFHAAGPPATLAGAGTFGVTHTERGLTWAEVFLSGHMVPQYAPTASFRQLEFLLGRVSSLTSKAGFTVNPFQN